jgi:hypothetical protein
MGNAGMHYQFIIRDQEKNAHPFGGSISTFSQSHESEKNLEGEL